MEGYEEERERLAREEWNRKIARMKAEKARKRRREQLMLKVVFPLVLIIVIVIVVVVIVRGRKTQKDVELSAEESYSQEVTQVSETTEEETLSEPEVAEPVNTKAYAYTESSDYEYLGSENMTSMNAILVNTDSCEIEGGVDYSARIVPASMTKVMTVLVASELIDDLDEKIPVTIEATDFSFANDCSAVGFKVGEMVTVEDLFYGTILCSGADAAFMLAEHVAGSQDAFVELMNKKCEDLGIASSTHFSNVAGVYSEDNYSTCYDIAVIMNAAMEDEFLSKVLSAHKYTTSKTTEHPDGLLISNWFLRRIEDFDTGGEVIGAKTGYVDESGCCAVSCSTQDDGTHYIAVSCHAHSNWRCIYDHIEMYKNHTSNASATPTSIAQTESDEEIFD